MQLAANYPDSLSTDEMPSSSSHLDAGDAAGSGTNLVDDAAWVSYMGKMTAWAKRALCHVKETTGNFDDVVVSAYRTALRRQKEGIVPAPENTEELWTLLRKCLNSKIDKYRKAARSKKNSGLRWADMPTEADQLAWAEGFVDNNPSPEHLDAYVKDAMQIVYDAVSDPQLREIGRLTAMSYDPKEIGTAMNLSVHQVRRRLGELSKHVQRALNQLA